MPSVHSRVGRGPPFGPKLPNFGHVPPLPFFPTTAVYSARHPAGLLHPASGHGVRHVSGLPLLLARRLGAGGSPSPVASHPSKLSPPRQVAARHRAPIPSRRCSGFPVLGPTVLPRLGPASFRPSLDLRALLRCEVRCGLPALPPPSCPMLPWAWSQAGSRCVSLRRSGERRVVGPAQARRPRGGRPWMVPDGPWAARGPSAVVPLWSEDRAGAVRSRCGPKTARGPAVDGPVVVRRPGAVRGSRARRRPARGQVGSASGGIDLIRSRGPEGLWFRSRPSADWSRGTGRCSRLAGRPRAVALLAPRVVRTRGPRRVLVGRTAGHPKVPGRRRGCVPEGMRRCLHHLLPACREASLGCLRPEGRGRSTGVGSGLPKELVSAAKPGLARPEGCVCLGSRLRCFSEEKRGASTCCRCRPEGWRGERGFCRPPRGEVDAAFARGRGRGFCRPPRGEVDAAFAFGLQRRIRPTSASSLHRRRVEPEGLAVPPAEAGGSSGPCPVTHPATEVVGPTIAAEAGQAKASRQAGTGARWSAPRCRDRGPKPLAALASGSGDPSAEAHGPRSQLAAEAASVDRGDLFDSGRNPGRRGPMKIEPYWGWSRQRPLPRKRFLR
jgi:hypothetical protein